MNLYKLSVAALALCLVFFSKPGSAAEPQVLKIGVQLPITGERASVGRLMLNGLQMALDIVNSQNLKLELVLADDESTPDGAVKALDKLIHDPQIVAIAGEINSPFVMASAPIVDKAGLPYLTAGSSPKTTLQSQWIFRVGASDALLADFLSRYIVDELKMKSVAIMHDKTGIHNQRADLVATVLKDSAGITPVANVTWSSGDRQFATQFEEVKASHPQAILALGETPEGGSFFRQAKTSGLQGQIIGQRDFGVRRVFEEAGDAANGAIIFTEYAPDIQGDATKAWNAAYKRLYASDANVIAAQYYDAVLLLAEAARTGGANRAGIKSGLEGLKSFPGVMADYTFDAGRNGVHRFYVARVSGGKLSLVKTLTEGPRQ